jgi:hypothetical protein
MNKNIKLIIIHLTILSFLMEMSSCKKKEEKLPEVQTLGITYIDALTVKCNGVVISDGNTPITANGVCWGPSLYLEAEYGRTNEGTGVGNFSSQLTNLMPGNSCYVRAYATNSVGTVYGDTILFTLPALELGLNYGGGKIFLLSGLGGLIAATVDVSANQFQWGCEGTSINTSSYLGFGSQNTNNIHDSCSTMNKAADMCLNYTLGGYNDWYLPSWEELTTMAGEENMIGGFANDVYWSSTEVNADRGCGYNFNGGVPASDLKSTPHRVRAIRSFSF